MEKTCYTYILANKPFGTLYVGFTEDLGKRLLEHRNDLPGSFTERYGVHMLVYYEIHQDTNFGILREKRIKHWLREWKIELIESQNPEWRDLSEVWRD